MASKRLDQLARKFRVFYEGLSAEEQKTLVAILQQASPAGQPRNGGS